jgi:putative peptidoglycan lipid II flippase
MKPLAHGGLALATSLASVLNLGLLVWALKKKLGILGWRSIARSVCKTLVSSLSMGLAVWVAGLVLLSEKMPTLTGLMGGVAGCIAIGICTYGCVSYVLKSAELHVVWAEVRKGIVR